MTFDHHMDVWTSWDHLCPKVPRF